MVNRKNTARTVGVAVAAVSLLGVVGNAASATASTTAGSRVPVAVTRGSSAVPTYSDADVVALLVFAKGPIAEKNPALAAKIRAGQPANDVSLADIAAWTAQLKALDPNFTSGVTKAVQAGDPYRAQKALDQLNADIKKWSQKAQVSSKDLATTQGFISWKAKTHVLVATNVVAVWQGAVYTTVAAGAEAVVLVAIVPAAASYEFLMDKPGSLEKQDYIASVTSIFAA